MPVVRAANVDIAHRNGRITCAITVVSSKPVLMVPLSLALLLSHPMTEDAATGCGPAARVEGEARLASAVSRALSARGVRSAAEPGCTTSIVYVERAGTSLQVTPPSSELGSPRQVSGVEAAAALIESWARHDLSAPLLQTRTLYLRPPSAAKTKLQLRLSMAFDVALDTHGTAWLGAVLRGCIQAGPACPGLVVRVAGAASDAVGPTEERFALLSADLLASLGFPISLRRVTLQPVLAAGLGLMRAQLQSPLSGRTVDGSFRGEAGLILSVLLGRGLGLDLSLLLGVNLPPKSGAHVLYQPPDRHQGRGSDDPRLIAVPENAWGSLRGSVGLSWMGP